MEVWTSWYLRVLSSVLLISVTYCQTTTSTSHPSSALRLAGGGTTYGRLEIYHDGQWGTVCDDSFGYSDAKVACRELGLDTSPVYTYERAHFGEGTGPIWLDSVQCISYETLLKDCAHDGFGVTDCSHAEDVGISCGSEYTSSSGGFNSGGWIGIVVTVVVLSVLFSVWRRRYWYNRAQRTTTTTTTTVIQPTTATTNNPNSIAVPTYYHTASTGGPPSQPPPPTGPGNYPKQPQAYPQQPYPQAANAGNVYPPAQQSGGTAPGTAQYPAQAYPPSVPGGTAPYPQQPGMGAGAPYPPPQQSGGPPPMYPPQAAAGAPPPADLPPPPLYNDVVKQ